MPMSMRCGPMMLHKMHQMRLKMFVTARDHEGFVATRLMVAVVLLLTGVCLLSGVWQAAGAVAGP